MLYPSKIACVAPSQVSCYVLCNPEWERKLQLPQSKPIVNARTFLDVATQKQPNSLTRTRIPSFLGLHLVLSCCLYLTSTCLVQPCRFEQTVDQLQD